MSRPSLTKRESMSPRAHAARGPRGPSGPAAALLLSVLLAVTQIGCRHAAGPGPSARPTAESSRETRISVAASDPARLEQTLRAEVHRWRGTPYCWGGQNRTCTDCSGFVRAVLGKTLGLRLPRTTSEMARLGNSVLRRQLRAGDLLFFRFPGKGRHVALYLRAGEFAHATTSSGVRISRLSERYWSERYAGARRVL